MKAQGENGCGLRHDMPPPIPVRCGGSERCMEVMTVSFVECSPHRGLKSDAHKAIEVGSEISLLPNVLMLSGGR